MIKLNFIKNLPSARTQNILLVGFMFFLLVISIYRIIESPYSFFSAFDGIDDWHRYARQGYDIKENGLLINSVDKAYNGPGGILYNYFIALNFLLFGDTFVSVFIIQALMLGASVSFVFWTFKDEMNTLFQYIYMGALFCFAFLDVYVNYTHQLLSENIGIFLFTVFFYCFIKVIREGNSKLLWICTLLIVLTCLSRPNVGALVPLYLGIIFYYRLTFFKINYKEGLGHIIIIILGGIFIPFRNYLISGDFNLFPTEGTSDSVYQLFHSGPKYFFDKVLFCFGYLSALEPKYAIRFHWIIMWLGYFYFILKLFTNKKLSSNPIIVTNLFILLYILTLIVFCTIHSYGYRYLLPINFFILSMSIIGMQYLFTGKIKSDGSRLDLIGGYRKNKASKSNLK